MESSVASAVTGVLTLIGALVSNSRSRAVMEVKIDELSNQTADPLAEFSISETGGIDGEPSDQTGSESLVQGYYELRDGILLCKRHNKPLPHGIPNRLSAECPRVPARPRAGVDGWHG